MDDTRIQQLKGADEGDTPPEMDEERRSFLESVMAASIPVHCPFTPAQVTLTTDDPLVQPDGAICKLCGLCDKCVECRP